MVTRGGTRHTGRLLPQTLRTFHRVTHGNDAKNWCWCKAQRSNPSPDPEEAQDEIVLSNWRVLEFWEGLTWDAAVPATSAVAVSWVLTDSFITNKLPEAQDSICILAWLAPCVLLDILLWAMQPQQPKAAAVGGQLDHAEQAQAPHLLQAGLATYQRQQREACRSQERSLPPVQKNVLLFLQTCAQQFAIQGVLSVAAIHLLLEANQMYPSVLPQLPGLPGMTHVDPSLAAACMGVMVCMVSYRVRCSARAFHQDHLERSTVEFMVSLGKQPAAEASSLASGWRATGGHGMSRTLAKVPSEVQGMEKSTRLAVALAAVRQSLILTSCTMVFLQTDSILASVWVAYVAANTERRLSRTDACRQ